MDEKIFKGHYDEWIKSRMAGIEKYTLPDYFKGKTLLELGGGHGHIGNKFHELGALVTTSDAREEHIKTVSEKYPHLKTLLIDGDSFVLDQKYDVILHWGLLYHLTEIENHLREISGKCDVLLLESEVSDSDEDDFYIVTEEKGYDQAFNHKGIRPSPAYVEKILWKNGFNNILMIKDSILNAYFHRYDWDISNSKQWEKGLRRFWICWKDDINILR